MAFVKHYLKILEECQTLPRMLSRPYLNKGLPDPGAVTNGQLPVTMIVSIPRRGFPVYRYSP